MILAIAVALAVRPMAQCAQDTLVDSHVVYSPLWLAGVPATSECPACTPWDRVAIAGIPDSINGQLVVACATNQFPLPVVQVMVVTDCNEVLVDTCLEMGDPATASYTVSMSFGIGATAWARYLWGSLDSVMFFIKGQPGSPHPPMPEPLYSMDTCWTATHVDDPFVPSGGIRIDPYTLTPVDVRKPNSRYLYREE